MGLGGKFDGCAGCFLDDQGSGCIGDADSELIRGATLHSQKGAHAGGSQQQRCGVAVDATFDGKVSGDFDKFGERSHHAGECQPLEVRFDIERAFDAADAESANDVRGGGVDFQSRRAAELQLIEPLQAECSGGVEREVAGGSDKRQQAAFRKLHTDVVTGFGGCAAIVAEETGDVRSPHENLTAGAAAGGFKCEIAVQCEHFCGERGVVGGKSDVWAGGKRESARTAVDHHGFRNRHAGGIDGQAKRPGKAQLIDGLGNGHCQFGCEPGVCEDQQATATAGGNQTAGGAAEIDADAAGGDDDQCRSVCSGITTGDAEAATDGLTEHLQAAGECNGFRCAGKEVCKLLTGRMGIGLHGDVAGGKWRGDQNQALRRADWQQHSAWVREPGVAGEMAGNRISGEHLKCGSGIRDVIVSEFNRQTPIQTGPFRDSQHVECSGKAAGQLHPQR